MAETIWSIIALLGAIVVIVGLAYFTATGRDDRERDEERRLRMAAPPPRLLRTRPHGLVVRTPPFQGGDRRFDPGWGYLVPSGWHGNIRSWKLVVASKLNGSVGRTVCP